MRVPQHAYTYFAVVNALARRYLIANGDSNGSTGLAASTPGQTRHTVAVDGVLFAATARGQQESATTDWNIEIELNGVVVEVLGLEQVGHGFFDLSPTVVAPGDRLEVALVFLAGVALNDTGVQLFVTPSVDPAQRGVTLPFAGLDNAVVPRFFWANAEATLATGTVTQSDTHGPSPVSGTITRVALNRAIAAAVTIQVLVNGVVQATFAIPAVANEVIVTGLAVAVTAGDFVEIVHSAGAASQGETVWTAFLVPTDQTTHGIVVAFGGDPGAAGTMMFVNSRASTSLGASTAVTFDRDNSIVWPFPTGRVRALAWARELTVLETTLFVVERIVDLAVGPLLTSRAILLPAGVSGGVASDLDMPINPGGLIGCFVPATPPNDQDPGDSVFWVYVAGE